MTMLQALHSRPPMNLGSLSFLALFLPLCLAVFYCAPQKLRRPVLLAASVGFYCLSDLQNLWLFAALVAADCALLQAMARARRNTRGTLFAAVVAGNAAAVAVLFVLAQHRQEAPPLGIAVAAASAVWCASTLRRGNVPDGVGPLDFALYAAFFPRLPAGPLVPFEDFFVRTREMKFSPGGMLDSFGRLVQGALKLLVLGANTHSLYLAIGAIPAAQQSVLAAWCRILALALALYFSLSGISDMAVGTAGLFGLRLPQNFYYPYQSHSVEDFFERFNGSVSRFARAVLVDPLPKRAGRDARGLCVLAAGALWGMWFGLRANYLAWGALLAFAVLLEHSVLKKPLETVPTLFRRAYALALVLLTLPVFDGETLEQIAFTYAALFRLDRELPLINDRIRYLLASNWLLLVVSVFLASSVMNLIVRQLRKAVPRISRTAFAAFDLAIVVVLLSFAVQATAPVAGAAGSIPAFAARLERQLLERVPERQRLREMNLALALLGGQREFRPGGGDHSGVFISERGLMRNIEQSNVPLLRANTDAIQAFSRAAADRQITTAVMLVPTAGAILQDDLPPYAQSVMVNQFQIIEDAYSRFVAPTVTINAYSALINRRNQYIYYRTEDNLTALGGFYTGQALASRLGLDEPRLSQYEISYSDTSYFGDLYALSPYANIAADTISQLSIPSTSLARQQYLVTRQSSSGAAVYHTMYPTHAAQLGNPLDVYFGGPAPVIDVRTSLSGAPRVLVFGDKTAAAWLPFLCDGCTRTTLVDLSAEPEELADINPDDYDIVLFGYGIESFIHTDLPSRALQFLEDES